MKLFEDIDARIIKRLPLKEQEKQILQRRINKLKRDPKGFLNTSFTKNSKKVQSKISKRVQGNHHFTVVSAVYNVESYLDDYFKSITSQSLSFKKNINIILIDDGSTDSSLNIIKKWQKKYPKNIFYFRKDNGGASSARNLGLEYLYEESNEVLNKNEYVSFIDPDDFLSSNYFEEIDKALTKNKKCKIVSCNMHYFYEKDKLVKDIHPLKFRYQETKSLPSNKLNRNILLSAATTFYNLNMLQSLYVFFDERVKPSFEDCKFNIEILSSVGNVDVIFLKESIYYYRQREDESSLMNNSWNNKSLFLETLQFGVLDSLELTKSNLGYVPNYIQNVALFHCIGYYRRLINAENNIEMLSIEEKNKFTNILNNIFEYIDTETILSYNLPNLQNKVKAGLLGFYKEEKHPISYFYINRINFYDKTISLSFFTHFLNDCIDFRVDNSFLLPIEEKNISSNFLGKNFYYERKFLIKYSHDEQVLKVSVNGRLVNLSCFTISLTGGDSIKNLISYLDKRTVFRNTKKSWILGDRNDKADDNAEHFYRYLKKNHSNLDVYYSLESSSNDWQRLNNEGFNLLDYGSKKFEQELKSSRYIVSSHLSIWNYFIGLGKETLSQKNNIWLQHGVIANNNANVVNTKHLDLMLTSTKGEYDSIADDLSEYNLLKSQVAMTGLPRHDNLLKLFKSKEQVNKIVVMPTWRVWLKKESLIESDYFKYWTDFLKDIETENLLKNFGYNITFVIHEEMKDFLNLFPKKDYINYENLADKSLQDIFATHKFMITDYSSVSFDMAFLEKPTLYYQFDSERFFNQHYKKGYFSYTDDGFGAVVETKEQLQNELKNIIANGGETVEPFTTRMRDTFPFRDGKNCERVYNAINQTYKYETNYIDLEIWKKYILQAKESNAWSLLEERSNSFIKHTNENFQKISEYDIYTQYFLESLYHQYKYVKILKYVSNNKIYNSDYWIAKVQLQSGHESKAIDYFKEYIPESIDDQITILFSSILYFDNELSSKLFNSLSRLELNKTQKKLLSLSTTLLRDEQEFLKEVFQFLLELNINEKKLYKLELIVSKLLYRSDDFSIARSYIPKYTKHSKGDLGCRILLIKLGIELGNFSEIITQYESSFNSNYLMPPKDLKLIYIKALCESKRWNKAEPLLESFYQLGGLEKYDEYLYYYLDALTNNKKWSKILQVISQNDSLNNCHYESLLAEYRLGNLEDLESKYPVPNANSSYRYWVTMLEISELNKNKKMIEYCLKGLIAVFPDKDKEKYWHRLQVLCIE